MRVAGMFWTLLENIPKTKENVKNEVGVCRLHNFITPWAGVHTKYYLRLKENCWVPLPLVWQGGFKHVRNNLQELPVSIRYSSVPHRTPSRYLCDNWDGPHHSGSLAIDCDKVHSHSKTTLLNLVSLITFRISIGFASFAAPLSNPVST